MPDVLHTIVSGDTRYEILEPGDDSAPVLIRNADNPSESVEILRRVLPRLVQILSQIPSASRPGSPNGHGMN